MNLSDKERRKRQLTDEDARQVAREIIKEVTGNLYHSIGLGVWGLAKKGLIYIVVILAAYGIYNGIKP